MRQFLRLAFRSIAVAVLCAAGVPVLVTGTIVASFIFLPLPAALPDPKPPAGGQVSRVYDQNGVEIGQFREFEQNIPVKPEDIPHHLKVAVIAAEDQNFYDHGGIDLRGSARALWADVRNRQIEQGGSTITQQYVKDAYVGRDRTLLRKVREAIIAAQLDRQADKEDILFRYLSRVYLGEGAIGVGAASETYFRKPISEIGVSEAALLAGLIPAPSRYEPRGNPELAEQKRKIVLNKMFEQGYIDADLHEKALAHPVWLLANGPPPGPATIVHPPPEIVFPKYPYFLDYVRRYLVEKHGEVLVFRGGLRIQTTLDPAVQDAAERAVAEALGGTNPPIEMALAAVEPPTGYVKGLVGGRDFSAPGGQVNLALGNCPDRPPPDVPVEVEPSCWDDDTPLIEGGGTGRQPGSSWKPFVLATAFEKGITPNKVYPAPSKICIRDYCPQNYEGSGGGSATVRTATVKSINTVYVQLGQDVGVKDSMEMAKKLGITSAWFSPRNHGLSLSLGAQEVSPLEMATAYGVFANRGERLLPTPVFRVEDYQGKAIEDNSDRDGERVIDEIVADNVTDVLRGVITGGTGTRANIGRPAAGKTGTAQEWRDAWFVGYTPSLSAAVWMGNRDRPTRLAGIKGHRRVAGGTIPAATWRRFMIDALEGVPVTEFSEPAPITVIRDRIRGRDREADRALRPGSRRTASGTDPGGPYVYGPGAPRAVAPTTTTTSSSTTTTVSLFPGGDDDDDED